jgi:hypothetical protein
MTENHHIIPVWFFVGLMLLFYGLLILGSGIAEWPHPPNTVLSNLHAPVWWGGLIAVLGAAYCIGYRPRRSHES